jgi:hypothetical protein
MTVLCHWSMDDEKTKKSVKGKGEMAILWYFVRVEAEHRRSIAQLDHASACHMRVITRVHVGIAVAYFFACVSVSVRGSGWWIGGLDYVLFSRRKQVKKREEKEKKKKRKNHFFFLFSLIPKMGN